MKLYPILLSLLLLLVWSCKEKTYVYEVNDLTVSPNSGEKTKQKSVEQFVSIAFANMYQRGISSSEMVHLSDLIRSIGDKQIAYEVIIAKMMTDPELSIPDMAEMRSDLSAFVAQTYRRFYVREPSEAEQTWWVNYLDTRPEITPQLVYYAFATSNEYYYY